MSAQAVSVIMRSLEEDGLLLRNEPVRGKVGQPSIPMSLNPDGAYSIGLKIGRRSADLVLLDFIGNQKSRLQKSYTYPTPQSIKKFAQKGIAGFETTLARRQRQRIAGIGVSVPFELWDWADHFGAPAKEMYAWKAFDFKHHFAQFCDYPVFLENDATAACGAELVFGHGKELNDFVYFFVGTFIGGGVVLNHSVFRGKSGNAGAFGSMPVTAANGGATQLIDHASLLTLETKLLAKKKDISGLRIMEGDWSMYGKVLDGWIVDTGKHLSVAIASSCATIDFSAAVIDGAFPQDVRQRLVKSTNAGLANLDLKGITPPEIREGQIGDGARAIGGACLPLFSRYLLDQNVLFGDSQ